MRKVSLHSFDIFDTLLTREVGPPHNIFILLADQSRDLLGDQIDRQTFIKERIAAEFAAIDLKPNHDVSLSEIYQQLQHRLKLSADSCAQCMQRELALEAKHLLPIPSMLQRIQKLRKAGARIAFVSDMYLPKAWVRTQLSQHGYYSDGDLLLVSGEDGGTKYKGILYQKLKAESRLSGFRIRHHGDNRRSDQLKAFLNSIPARHIKDGLFDRSESILANHSSRTAGLSGLFAGVSRIERISVRATPHKEQQLARIAASTIAPILCAFTLSTLIQAKQAGCKRLYFLSRDGYILHKLASQMSTCLGLDIQCRYLYASRLVWELAAIFDIDDEAIQQILQVHLSSSLSEIALRIDLTAQQLQQLIDEPALNSIDPDQALNREHTALLKKHLTTNAALKENILAKAKHTRTLTQEYLAQEQVYGDDWAFVDVGWMGTMQKCYRRIHRQETTPPQSRGYYFGHLKKSEDPHIIKHGWMFEPEQHTVQEVEAELITIIESFCSAPHSSLRRYLRDESTQHIVPSFRAANSEALNRFGMSFVCQQILAYNDRLTTTLAHFDLTQNLQPCMRELLLQFIHRPTREEAKTWGSIPFESVPTETEHETIASSVKLSLANLWDSTRYGRIPSQNYVKWAAASLILSPTYKRVLYSLVMKPGQLARRSKRLTQLSKKLSA